MIEPLHYRDGYRFQVDRPYAVKTPIEVAVTGNAFVGLAPDGTLTIAAGYAWDGASGPVPQTKRVIRASLIHDAGYQMIRELGLPYTWRKTVDVMFRDACIADGMPRPIAYAYYAAVRLFGARHTDPSAARPVLVDPASATREKDPAP